MCVCVLIPCLYIPTHSSHFYLTFTLALPLNILRLTPLKRYCI